MKISQDLINTIQYEIKRLESLSKDLLKTIETKVLAIKSNVREQQYEQIIEERKNKPKQFNKPETSDESRTQEKTSLFEKIITGGALIGGGLLLSDNAEASTNPFMPIVPTKGVGETGNSSEAIAFFESKGWTNEQAIGIVANLQAESGANLRTDALGDGGKAYGIAQWHPDRQQRFQEVYGKPIQEAGFKEQLEFVNWELNNSEKPAGDDLRQASTVEEATAIVNQKYERSALGQKGIHTDRIANALELQKTPQKTNETQNMVNVDQSIEKVKEEKSTQNNPQASIEPIREAPINNEKIVELAESRQKQRIKTITNNIIQPVLIAQSSKTVSDSDTTVSTSLPSPDDLKQQYMNLA